MPTTIKPYRYQLPKKAIKIDCPHCGERKTWSRYVDTRTGEPLPESFGRCDRESNCSQHVSPYHKGPSGLSYVEEIYQQHKMPPIPKAWFRMVGKWKRNGTIDRYGAVTGLQDPMFGATPEQAERVAAFIYDQPAKAEKPIPAVYAIPDEVYRQSLRNYDQNIFVELLCERFGETVVNEVLQRFAIGTSTHWPGATVFWYIDEQGRKRGGQIKLFNPDWHTAKYKDREGKSHSKTSWVHYALIKKASKAGVLLPDWLREYNEKADCCPCMFGLPQLLTAPFNKPIAVVESPKTAILCSLFMPDFIWLAVGSLSNLTTRTDAGLARLAPLRGRTIQFYPDLSTGGTAFQRWSKVAELINKQGFSVTVSDLLETLATDEQRQAGFDLADFLLMQSSTLQPVPPPMPTSPPVVTRWNAPYPMPYRWDATKQIAGLRQLILLPGEVEEPTPQIVSTLAEWNGANVLRPNESDLTRLHVKPGNDYPAEWDEPNPPDAVPTLRIKSFHEFQQEHPYFSKMGLLSLPVAPQG